MLVFSYRVAKTAVSLQSLVSCAPTEVQQYFKHLPDLLASYPLDVSLAYLFARVELAHNMAIYCGIAKIHRADAALTKAAVDRHHMNRDGFRDLFAAVYGAELDTTALGYIEEAEKIRDKVMHGKRVSGQDKRTAICRVIHYSVKLNEQTSKIAGLKLFGPLRGFKGRTKPLDKSTSRWILKGVGLPIS